MTAPAAAATVAAAVAVAEVYIGGIEVLYTVIGAVDSRFVCSCYLKESGGTSPEVTASLKLHAKQTQTQTQTTMTMTMTIIESVIKHEKVSLLVACMEMQNDSIPELSLE